MAEVCRFAEGGDGCFRLVSRFPLGVRRPRRARSSRRAAVVVKWMASMPRAAAAATLAGLSSMKIARFGGEPVAGEAAAVDLGVGLEDAFVPGDDDVAEDAGEERETAPGLGPFRAGEVGDGVERNAGGGELGEELGGAFDRARAPSRASGGGRRR